MLKGLEKTPMIILFLLAGFLLLATLGESLGQIKVLPGSPASPTTPQQGQDQDQAQDQDQDQDEDEDKKKGKQDDLVDEELKRLELALTRPLIFYIMPTLEEEGYVFETKE